MMRWTGSRLYFYCLLVWKKKADPHMHRSKSIGRNEWVNATIDLLANKWSPMNGQAGQAAWQQLSLISYLN